MKAVTWTALLIAVLALALAGFAVYEALSVQQSVFLDW
jgi:hypothetical protein